MILVIEASAAGNAASEPLTMGHIAVSQVELRVLPKGGSQLVVKSRKRPASIVCGNDALHAITEAQETRWEEFAQTMRGNAARLRASLADRLPIAKR